MTRIQKTANCISVSWLACAAFVLVSTSASAQPTTSFNADVFNAANMTAPVTSFVIQMSSVTCGLAPTNPAAVVPNPVAIEFALADADTTVCKFSFNQPGPLVALPFDPNTTYRMTLRAVNITGQSAPTTSLNSFTKPGQAPASPARVRVSGS